MNAIASCIDTYGIRDVMEDRYSYDKKIQIEKTALLRLPL